MVRNIIIKEMHVVMVSFAVVFGLLAFLFLISKLMCILNKLNNDKSSHFG